MITSCDFPRALDRVLREVRFESHEPPVATDARGLSLDGVEARRYADESGILAAPMRSVLSISGVLTLLLIGGYFAREKTKYRG